MRVCTVTFPGLSSPLSLSGGIDVGLGHCFLGGILGICVDKMN